MTKHSKFDDDVKKAKSFFKKKLDEDIKFTDSKRSENFRDLDDDTIKISKLSARIDFLKDSLRKKKPDKKVKSKSLDKTFKKKKIIKNFTLSKKSKDINGNPLKNYISKVNESDHDSYVILKDFEINSKLFIAGNINKLPKDLIIDLIENKMIENNDKVNQKQSIKKTFFVKETFGLSQIKRSKLRNTKKFKN